MFSGNNQTFSKFIIGQTETDSGLPIASLKGLERVEEYVYHHPATLDEALRFFRSICQKDSHLTLRTAVNIQRARTGWSICEVQIR